MKTYSILVISLFISFVGCQSSNSKITLYKNTGEIDRPYDTTAETFWDFKQQGDIDSLLVRNLEEFTTLYSSFSTTTMRSTTFLNPEYAIVISTPQQIDTLYLNVSLNKVYNATTLQLYIPEKNTSVYNFFKKHNFLSEHTKYKYTK